LLGKEGESNRKKVWYSMDDKLILKCEILSSLIHFCTVKWTKYMEQSPSWEANSHSASQEIPYLLWNLKSIPHLPTLVYANNVNILGRNVHIIKKNTGQLEATVEVGLEISRKQSVHLCLITKMQDKES
jgi:hypothetical protein